jgi:hypothetical protein
MADYCAQAALARERPDRWMPGYGAMVLEGYYGTSDNAQTIIFSQPSRLAGGIRHAIAIDAERVQQEPEGAS